MMSADVQPFLAYSEDQVTPGVLGLLVVVLLGVATWLLLRSLNRHLGRVRFDDSSGDRDSRE
jgi:hypothetical protein